MNPLPPLPPRLALGATVLVFGLMGAAPPVPPLASSVALEALMPSPEMRQMPPPEPPPPPPKPARVSLVAFPGGRITVDGAVAGNDATTLLSLKPGKHYIRIENRFLGEHTTTVEVTVGQTGTLTIEW